VSAKNSLEAKRARRAERAAARSLPVRSRSARCLGCEELLVMPAGHTICRPCLADVVTDMVMERLANDGQEGVDALAEELGLTEVEG
jgi:hypothetical protein